MTINHPVSSLVNGELWKDTAGNEIHAHGGGLVKEGDAYYWFGENRHGNRKVSCYRSRDLMNWEFRKDVLTTSSTFEPFYVRTHPELNPEGSKPRYGTGATIERPKVLYNKLTGRYIMWMHWENGQDYKDARCAVASCSIIDGDYTYHGSFNPIGYMSRDCTLFQDEDGTSYFISSSRDNADLHIYRLSDDYMSIDEHVKTLWPGQYREAPTLFKRGKYYFLMTSACTGWHPNQAKYACAQSITGRWSILKNVGDSTTYQSQPTYVLPIEGTSGTEYLYIGDRWDPENYYNSRYVFLPLEFPGEDSLALHWADRLQIDLTAGKIMTR